MASGRGGRVRRRGPGAGGAPEQDAGSWGTSKPSAGCRGPSTSLRARPRRVSPGGGGPGGPGGAERTRTLPAAPGRLSAAQLQGRLRAWPRGWTGGHTARPNPAHLSAPAGPKESVVRGGHLRGSHSELWPRIWAEREGGLGPQRTGQAPRCAASQGRLQGPAAGRHVRIAAPAWRGGSVACTRRRPGFSCRLTVGVRLVSGEKACSWLASRGAFLRAPAHPALPRH